MSIITWYYLNKCPIGGCNWSSVKNKYRSFELEWAQNKMGFAVAPITPADVVDSVFTETTREQGLKLSTMMKEDPQKHIAELSVRKDDLSCFFSYRAPVAKELIVVGREVEELLVATEALWIAAVIEQQRRLLSETKLRRQYIRAQVKQSIAQEVGISKEDGSEEAVLEDIRAGINEELANGQKADWAWKFGWTQHAKKCGKVRAKKRLRWERRHQARQEKESVNQQAEQQRWRDQKQAVRKLELEYKSMAGKSWEDPRKWKPVLMCEPEPEEEMGSARSGDSN